MFRKSDYRVHRALRPQSATPVPVDLTALVAPTMASLTNPTTGVLAAAIACMALLPVFIGIRLVPRLIKRFAR